MLSCGKNGSLTSDQIVLLLWALNVKIEITCKKVDIVGIEYTFLATDVLCNFIENKVYKEFYEEFYNCLA